MRRPIHHEIDEPVLTSIGTGRYRRDEPRPDALRDHTVLEPFPDAGDVRDRCHHFETGHIDVLSASRLVSVIERHQTTCSSEGSCSDIRLTAGQAKRGIRWVADRDHRTPERAGDEIIGTKSALGARLSEPGHRGQYEPGMVRRKIGVPKTQSGEGPDGKGFDNQVRVGGEFAKPKPIRIRLQIE
jgi:hypothetical protein